MTRLRQQESVRRSVEAESVQRMLQTSYRDYLKDRRDPLTGAAVFPLRFGGQK